MVAHSHLLTLPPADAAVGEVIFMVAILEEDAATTIQLRQWWPGWSQWRQDHQPWWWWSKQDKVPGLLQGWTWRRGVLAQVQS
jgi:hypothetical protein